MFLKSLALQNFRNYEKATFDFTAMTILFAGPNSAGKTNLLEAINLLSLGKSFKTQKDLEMIMFGQGLSRVSGTVVANLGEVEGVDLAVLLATGEAVGKESFSKRFFVNNIPKRRTELAGNMSTVLFSPVDIDIVIGGPSLRRGFLDTVLEQVDRDYALAVDAYIKAVRQRNALLEIAREQGVRHEKQFAYWDESLIKNSQIIQEKRHEFVTFVNKEKKDLFDFVMFYDKSEMSEARLLQYREAEMASGVTLIGPHRDDFTLSMYADRVLETKDMRQFASRGQQRIAMLQLKILQLLFTEEKTGRRPLLLLDDIFSELDESHIQLVLEEVGRQQTFITTTHEQFVPDSIRATMQVIPIEQRLT